MGKMMPGRIRQQGIGLYEAGKLSIEGIHENVLHFMVAGEEFYFSLQELATKCSCSLFEERHYCQHLAAVEYFLRNDKIGKEYIKRLNHDQELVQKEREGFLAGDSFLEAIAMVEEIQEPRYQLGIEGNCVLFDQNISWTLKLARCSDKKYYVVRDIGIFLDCVQKRRPYLLGRQSYVTLFLEEFDKSSQRFLLFLQEIFSDSMNTDRKGPVHYLRFPAVFFEKGVSLAQELPHFLYQDGSSTYPFVLVENLDASSELYAFQLTVLSDKLKLRIDERSKRSLLDGRYLCTGNQLYRVDAPQKRLIETIEQLEVDESGSKSLSFDFHSLERLALSLLVCEKIGRVDAPKKFRVKTCTSRFVLSLGVDKRIRLDLSLDFGEVVVSSEEELELLPFVAHYAQIKSIVETLKDFAFKGMFSATHPPLSPEAIYPFFSALLPVLRMLGEVRLTDSLQELYAEVRPEVFIESAGGLLDISFDVAGMSEEEIARTVQALWQNDEYVTMPSGRVVILDEESKKMCQALARLRGQQNSNGHVQVSRFSAYPLMDSFGESVGVHFSEELQKLAYDLSHPEEFHLEPLSVQAAIRDYQYLGIQWLSMLASHGFGGILADDMGLGKTLQTIAFLSHQLTEQKRVLILSPSSLVYNWLEEFRRFAPQLSVTVVYGNKKERQKLLSQSDQIVITSYASFRQDIEEYQEHFYDYLILDEAQVMKNAQTKIAHCLREFRVGCCFALSGTPIENQLTEIWSIFQIVLPGLFPTKSAFQALSASEVAQVIRPFILRRRKEEVLTELPALIETTILNELTEEQKVVYLAQLRQMQSTWRGAGERELNRRKIEILSGITRLRQICDTPRLFLEQYEGDSGKLESLRELLMQLKEGGHRVLIFSQFRSMLENIAQEVADLGLTSYLLTGSTPANKRHEMTRAFNAGSRDVFLVSLKAGGVGLNLTGADTVILVDLWWNPSVEEQAISRAHRMGQEETVECYRLITRGTIEEKILALQDKKRELVTTVLDGNEDRGSMTVDELRDILGIF